ncbi:hypothetical protein [Metallibacterium sp.]
MTPNNAINSDSEKRRAFVAPLFTAGYGKRLEQVAKFPRSRAVNAAG